jgi:hypothetical protein
VTSYERNSLAIFRRKSPYLDSTPSCVRETQERLVSVPAFLEEVKSDKVQRWLPRSDLVDNASVMMLLALMLNLMNPPRLPTKNKTSDYYVSLVCPRVCARFVRSLVILQTF